MLSCPPVWRWEASSKAILYVFLVPGRVSNFPGPSHGPSRRRSGCGAWVHVVLKTGWPLEISPVPGQFLGACQRAIGPFPGCSACVPCRYVYSLLFESVPVILHLKVQFQLGPCPPRWSRVFGSFFPVLLGIVG